MKFYGNGIVRLDKDTRVRFSKPKIKYTKGEAEINDPKISNKLIALGYEYVPEEPPIKRAASKPVKKKEVNDADSKDK